MSVYRYQALGPLQAGEGSRAFLGLAINAENKAIPVVIIWVPEGADSDPELLAKIRRETEHASHLDHPHIVTVIGFGKLDEGHARVVEFADGESLRKILDTAKKLPPRIAARVLLDACTAIHYAHIAGNDDGAPLVHGDLRPETMLISFQGVTKITGYGALAFAPREMGGLRVKGRRVHSAPEQIIGGRASVTITTDVYLLGITLYECLTGTVPWADQGDFFDHAVLTLPLPPATPGDIPPGFEAIIQKACAKKANDRYPNPLAMREALELAAGSDVATDEELAKFLEELFPQSHQLRADRRHTIDAGIADFVRRQWVDQEGVKAAGGPPPPPPDVSAPPMAAARGAAAPPPPPKPAPAGPAHQHQWTEPVVEEEEGPAEGSSVPWLIALAVFIAVIAGWWALKKAHEPIPGVDVTTSAPKASTGAGQPPIEVGIMPSAPAEPTIDAGVEAPTAVAVPEPVAPAVEHPPTAAPAVVAAPAPDVAVSIESSPEVELLLEGKSVGRTPWKGRLPPGRKVFTLQNKALGISTTRSLSVRGEAVSETFTVEKGSVAVAAPDGAAVLIDGVRVGTAPITGEIPVYEGSHRILVTVGQSKWTEPFSLRAGEHLSFNVELQQ